VGFEKEKGVYSSNGARKEDKIKTTVSFSIVIPISKFKPMFISIPLAHSHFYFQFPFSGSLSLESHAL
jgi:hypothetical protein